MSTPALRFKNIGGKEFSVWQKKNLGSIADVTKLAGYEFTKHIVYSDNGNIIALRALNVKDNKLDLTDVKYIDGSDFSKLNRSMLIVNDLLFTYVGTIGEVALIVENNRFYLAPNVARIRLDENLLLPPFALQYFNNSDFKKKQINLYIATSSQPALSMENIRKFEINLPSIPEQNKIANFLSAMDEKITQLTQKHELLNKYKKGVAQQIFSQKLQFKDKNFTDWKTEIIADIAEVIVGGTPSTANPDYWDNGDVPWISSGELNNGIIKAPVKYITPLGLKKSSAKLMPKNTTVLAMTGATLGRIGFLSFEACGNQSVAGFILNENFHSKFLFYSFFYNINKVFTLAAGGAQKGINKGSIESLKFSFPSFQEQQKIANFLTVVDKKISLAKSQLDLIKKYKQGLLQKMFV
jgi:type I restriction enzyme S subunit